MRSQPTFSLEIRARIEQERNAIFNDSKRFNLLFLPKSTAFQAISEFQSATNAPRQAMSATMESQIRDFTKDLIDAEAMHLISHPATAETFAHWIDELAKEVEALVKMQVSDQRLDFHCKAEDRVKFVVDSIEKRCGYWIGQKQRELARIAEGPRREAPSPVPVRNRSLINPASEKRTEGSSQRSEPKSITERLDEAAIDEDITHEEQAHRIGIGKTAYYDVKRGKGGKKARMKTEHYLNRVFSG